MPEKGWVIVTVREKTKKVLKQVSAKEGKSINDLIAVRLTSQQAPSQTPSQTVETTFILTSQDRENLKKLHSHLVMSRNRSQADLIRKILGEH